MCPCFLSPYLQLCQSAQTLQLLEVLVWLPEEWEGITSGSLQNWDLLQYRQADEWNMHWKTQVKLYYTHHSPFRLFCLLLKKHWHWFLCVQWKSAAKNPLWVQAEILGCTLILSHLSASPLSAEILLGDLGSSLMQEGSVSPDFYTRSVSWSPELWSGHRAGLHGIQISVRLWSCLLGFSLKTR